jgi:hypothetical protein
VTTARESATRRPWFDLVAGQDNRVYFTSLSLSELQAFPELETLTKGIDKKRFDQTINIARFDLASKAWSLIQFPLQALQDTVPLASTWDARLIGVDIQGNLYFDVFADETRYVTKVTPTGQRLWIIKEAAWPEGITVFWGLVSEDRLLLHGYARDKSTEFLASVCQVNAH